VGLGVKVTTFWTGIFIFFPDGRVIVLGSCIFVSKMPKRRSSMRALLIKPCTILSKIVWTILDERFLERPCSSVIAVARSFLIILLMGFYPVFY